MSAEEYKPTPKELVNIVNDLVGHTFAFSKFFINEFEKNDQFDLEKYITKNFFEEVFLALVDQHTRDGSITGKSQRSDKTRMARSLIRPYIEKHCQHASYTPIKLTNAQQIAKYEGTKIHTAYINNITLHFGNQLCGFLNSVSRKQQIIKKLTQDMKERGRSEEEIKKAIKTDVLDVCHKLKTEISSKNLPTLPANLLTETAINQIQSFLNVYPNDQFLSGSKNGIF